MSDDGYPDAFQGVTLIKTPNAAGSGYKGVSSRPAGIGGGFSARDGGRQLGTFATRVEAAAQAAAESRVVIDMEARRQRTDDAVVLPAAGNRLASDLSSRMTAQRMSSATSLPSRTETRSVKARQ